MLTALLLNASAGSTETLKSQSSIITYIVSGTFGGAKVTAQVSPDKGITWVTLKDLEITDASAGNLYIAKGISYRFTITGGTGVNLNIYAALE